MAQRPARAGWAWSPISIPTARSARSARARTRRTTSSITWTGAGTSATCTGRRRSSGAPRRCCGSSDHPRPEHLQVPAVEAVGVDRMVRARARPVQELQPPVEPVGGLDHVLLELLQAEQPGAGAGDEDPARLDQADRELVQVLVLLASLPVAVALAGEEELRGIEHDHVPGLAVLRHLPRVGEGVGVHELEPDLVDVRVALGLGERGLVQVHAGDLLRPARHLGVEREASGVAAEIEHPRAAGEARQRLPVLALVAEKAGLVPLGEVHLVADAVLADLHQAGRRGIGLVEGRGLDALEAPRSWSTCTRACFVPATSWS